MFAMAESLSVRCGSRLVKFRLGQGGYVSRGEKHVFTISMPAIETSGAARKNQMNIYGMSSSLSTGNSANR